jgi:hypothetical protein
MDTIRDPAIITAAGAAGLFFFGRPVLRALRARRWPHAQGTVTRSWIETRVPGPSYLAVGLAALFFVAGLVGLIRLLVS